VLIGTPIGIYQASDYDWIGFQHVRTHKLLNDFIIQK
jgi:hypothetical protein